MKFVSMTNWARPFSIFVLTIWLSFPFHHLPDRVESCLAYFRVKSLVEEPKEWMMRVQVWLSKGNFRKSWG
jgi:hypothetical protein